MLNRNYEGGTFIVARCCQWMALPKQFLAIPGPQNGANGQFTTFFAFQNGLKLWYFGHILLTKMVQNCDHFALQNGPKLWYF